MTELFAGETIHKTAVGRTPAVSGTVTLTPTAVESARVTADLGQLKSDRGPRDSYLHTHALETDTIPNATFVLAAPTPFPSRPAAGAPMQIPVTGRLTLHGVTRESAPRRSSCRTTRSRHPRRRSSRPTTTARSSCSCISSARPEATSRDLTRPDAS
jgi:hypothetical protein